MALQPIGVVGQLWCSDPMNGPRDIFYYANLKKMWITNPRKGWMSVSSGLNWVTCVWGCL